MINKNVIVATNAVILANVLREKINEAGFRVLSSGNVKDLSEKIENSSARLVLLENSFQGDSTDNLIRRLKKRFRHLRVAVWSASEVKPVIAARFLYAGAESFFSLREDEANVDKAVNKIVWGQRYCPADVEAVIDREGEEPMFDLAITMREREVIKMAGTGKSNEHISGKLRLSVNTVKAHKKKVYRKCGGNTAFDIQRYGIKNGIITMDDLI
jgi:DNA-binding NarL/FixJ family response regulator